MSFRKWLMAIAGCALAIPALADAAAERAAIVATMQHWEAAVESGDFGQLADYYTEDAVYYPNHSAPVVGRERILERNRQRGSGTAVTIEQRVDNVDVNGNWAVYSCVARIEVSRPGSDAPAIRQARVLLVMRQGEDGRWRIYRDIDNDPPEPN